MGKRAGADPHPSFSPEQAVREQEHDDDDRDVEEELAICRHEIFPRRIRKAEQERGRQRSGDRARSADGDDDEKRHHVAQGVIGFDREKLRADHASERGQSDGKRERQEIEDIGADAERFRHVAVVDRGPQPDAEIGPVEQQPERERGQSAAYDDEDPMRRNHAKADVHRAAEPAAAGEWT